MTAESAGRSSALELARDLLSHYLREEAWAVLDPIPLCDESAPEATDLMARILQWDGKFFEARCLITKRVAGGMPLTGALKVRLALGELLIGDRPTSPIIDPKEDFGEEIPASADWVSFCRSAEFGAINDLPAIWRLAKNPENFTRLLVDPFLQSFWAELPMRFRNMGGCVKHGGIHGTLEHLADAYFDRVELGITSIRDIWPKYRPLFVLDINTDTIRITSESRSAHPVLAAEFVEMATRRMRKNQIFIQQALDEIHRAVARYRPLKAELHCQRGQPFFARQELLEAGACDPSVIQTALTNPIFNPIIQILHEYAECEQTVPGALDLMRRAGDLAGETHRQPPELDSLLMRLSHLEIIKHLKSVLHYHDGQYEEALAAAEDVDLPDDPSSGLIRLSCLLKLHRFAEAQEVLENIHPTFLLHPFTVSQFAHILAAGLSHPLLRIFEPCEGKPVTQVSALPGKCSVFLTLNEASPSEEHEGLMAYPLGAFHSAGDAVRVCKAQLRTVVENIAWEGAAEEDLRDLCHQMGIGAMLLPDLRPNFSPERLLEDLISSVSKDACQSQEQTTQPTTP